MAIEIIKTAGVCPVCKKRNHELAPDIPGDICDECQEKILKEASLVVCNKCHHIAAVVKHGETPEGFVFEPNKTYTTDSCIKCTPFTNKLLINELEDYLKQNNKKSDFIVDSKYY